MIPDFSSDIDPASDPEAFIVARFLHDNCFKTVLERDSAGWSPLCYAVVNGDAFLVKALLKSKADPNDRLSKITRRSTFPRTCQSFAWPPRITAMMFWRFFWRTEPA